MKKIIILFLILFISFIFSVSSLKIFEIDETDKLSLGLEAADPDADKLAYTFTNPLNENGEWQTNYGDAGEYKATVSVSDGENEISEEVLIIVNRKEAKPTIDDFAPKEGYLSINEGEIIGFRADASDLNNDKIIYTWLLNDKAISGNNEISFETGYNDAGEYVITLIVSDGVFNASKEWNVKVNDVDISSVLEQINDVTILETETAKLELPDFEKYGLHYEISEPMGNDNKWETGYDDAGEYIIKITAEGKGFKGEEDVKVTVKNNDRAPKLIGLHDASVKENELLNIELKAVDPDDDNVILSAENMPQDAEFEENVFTWKPGYDFVQKNNAFDYLLDGFRVLGRSTNVVFVAQSNELSDKENVKITVKDVNRPFVLEGIDGIEVDEGEEIILNPKYNDPDNDKVSFSYSGFMDSNKKSTGYDDAGEYIVKVTATDGFNTETRFVDVEVNDVNRKPAFGKMENIEVKEGDEARIELSASDPDNDAVRFSAKNLPKGALLKDNLFVWKPGFDAVNGTQKEFSVDFTASDGIDEAEQKVKITAINVNQAPKIISYSDNLIAFKNKPTLFEINAVDEDGDELAYNWDFGFLDKFEGNSQHQRIFTATGKKKVEVTASDGVETVSKVWDVTVV